LKRICGYADVDRNILISPTTIFKIGSITKQVVAALTLKVVEKGKIDLHTPIAAYLSPSYGGWGHRMPAWARVVTPHHLLTNSSGIPDHVYCSEFQSLISIPHTKADILAHISKQGLLFEPGTSYGYSNSGYALLGEIVECVMGQTYQDMMRTLILEPAGLNSTQSITLREEGDPVPSIVQNKNYAWGYLRSHGAPDHLTLRGNAFPVSSYACHTMADGSLISTAKDLHKWNLSLYNGAIISQPYLAEMLRPHVRILHPPPIARANKKLDLWYGYGIVRAFNPRLNITFYRHGGLGGFRTELLYCPETEVTVVYLSNATWSDQKTDPMRDIRRFVQDLCVLARDV